MTILTAKIMQFVVALLLTASLISAYDILVRKVRGLEPIENWFHVKQIYVADVGTGEDVSVLYDRDIIKPFKGTYTVKVAEINDTGTGFPLCDNSEVVNYTPKGKAAVRVITLSEFVGEPCTLKDGRYRVEAAWFIERDGYDDEIVESVSNVFSVGPVAAK